MPLLIVLLPRSTAPVYRFATSSDGQRTTQSGEAALDLLPAGGRGVEVVAVVPAEQLSWHQVTLPHGIGPRSARLPAVLAGLLEERLLQEPAQLHLALGPGPAADGRHWVAACHRDWLVGHLQALAAGGRPVSRIVPELAPEASQPLLIAAGQPSDAWLLASGPALTGGVLALPLTAPSLALLQDQMAAAQGTTPPQILAEPAVAQTLEQLLDAPVTLVAPAERLLAASRTDWNLAQGALARGGAAGWARRAARSWRTLAHAPQWRPLRWSLAALIIVQALGVLAWRHQVTNELAMRRAQINRILTQTFTHVHVVVDAPIQMAREVAQLRQQSGAVSASDLEPMLSAWANVAEPAQTPTAVEFSTGQLRLLGLTPDDAQLARLQDQLQTQGYALQRDADALTLHAESQP